MDRILFIYMWYILLIRIWEDLHSCLGLHQTHTYSASGIRFKAKNSQK